MAKYDRQPYSVLKRGAVYYYRLEGSKAYRSTGCKNPIEAKAFARQKWEAAQNAPATYKPLTLGQALEPYFTEQCPHADRVRAEGKQVGAYYQSKALASIKKYVLTDPIADILLTDLKRSHIVDWRNRQVKKYGMTTSVKMAVTYLKTPIKEMYFREELQRDPTNGIGTLKTATKPRDRFTDSELAALFTGRPGNFASGLAWDVFRFAALTGMRKAEILALSWPQIDLVGNSVNVDRAWKQFDQTIGAPKWGKIRRTPLLPEAREIALRQEVRGEFVFCYPTGESLGGTWWAKNFKIGLTTAGIDRPGLTAHSLRHTINSVWRAAGVPDYVIRSVLGWSSEAVQDKYSHVTADDLRSLPSV
jgi:integrase